eukprot:8562505-Alexandrium_andersonii.AAC.1
MWRTWRRCQAGGLPDTRHANMAGPGWRPQLRRLLNRNLETPWQPLGRWLLASGKLDSQRAQGRKALRCTQHLS